MRIDEVIAALAISAITSSEFIVLIGFRSNILTQIGPRLDLQY